MQTPPEATATTRGPGRRRRPAVLAMVLAVVATIGAACGVVRTSFAGGNRFGTAAALSDEAHPDGSDVVLVATGTGFADALAAAPLASFHDAPILLTGTDRVPEETEAAIDALEATTAILLGGEAAISDGVEETLSATLEVTRHAGADRYETAATLAGEAFPDGTDVALVATGTGFADAIAAGPLAASKDAAILLTRPSQLPQATQGALDGLGVREVILLGGPAAISDAVEAELARSFAVTRYAGADRYETAATLATAAFPDGADVVLLATGQDFPDALAASPLAEAEQAPILLTGPDGVPDATSDALDALAPTTVRLIGGVGAISDDIESRLSTELDEVDRIFG